MSDPHSYSRFPSKNQLVMGVHTLEELLRYAPEKILKIYTLASKKSLILEHAKEKNIPIHVVAERFLTKMVGSESHQGFVAHIKERAFLDVKKFLQKEQETSFVLMLDQIFDPQNFGALIRSAECFGLDAVIWSQNRGSDLTAVAAKASSGASELIPLIRVANLANAVDQFKEGGFQVVVATLDESSQSAYTFEYEQKTVLIVGSEGEGVQPLLRKKADRSIYLPMEGKISSLNVAQATSALLALFRYSRPGKR